VWEISNPTLRRPVVSATFHGRDILAPAAAHLLKGGDPTDLGPPRHGCITLRNFEPTADEEGFVGEVIFRDTFGNLITNLRADNFADSSPTEWEFEVAGERVSSILHTYADRPTGTLIALVGSSGWVEIAVVNGDAARTLTAGAGTTVWARRRRRL
jgi:S-adenosylmethionine hydrolase